MDAWWEPRLEVDVIEGPGSLQRALEPALREGRAALQACHQRSVRGATPERGGRRSEARVTARPDGRLTVQLALGEAATRDPRRAAADAEADRLIHTCLVRVLGRTTLRPRSGPTRELRVLLRYEPVFHPARPCSDMSAPVR